MAFGAGTFTAAGGAVADLFGASALGYRATGSRLQAESYDTAAALAGRNVEFARISTAVKQTQAERNVFKIVGGQQADIAASGFAAVGSSLDILRSSMQQGALERAVLGQQGLIEEASYQQQAESFRLQAQASRVAAQADRRAQTGAYISAGIKGLTAIASIFTPPGT